jgi:hypothetical protein
MNLSEKLKAAHDALLIAMANLIRLEIEAIHKELKIQDPKPS